VPIVFASALCFRENKSSHDEFSMAPAFALGVASGVSGGVSSFSLVIMSWSALAKLELEEDTSDWS